jgi:hypothetical protein
MRAGNHPVTKGLVAFRAEIRSRVPLKNDAALVLRRSQGKHQSHKTGIEAIICSGRRLLELP